MTIHFYRPGGDYDAFSNFSRHRVQYRAWSAPTSEHLFQAMKFHPHAPGVFQAVLDCQTPKEAARMGRDRFHPIRADWDLPCPPDHNPCPGLEVHDGIAQGPVVERVKDRIMWEVVMAKFSQHHELKELLLSTGQQPIVEASPVDGYWGWGADQRGLNRLGRILMGMRDYL